MWRFLSNLFRKDKKPSEQKGIIGRDGSVRLNVENTDVQKNILKAVRQAQNLEASQSKTRRSVRNRDLSPKSARA